MKRTLLFFFLLIGLPGLLIAQPALQEGLSLKYLVRQPARVTNKTPVLILMHGYGSNEADLFGLSAQLPAHFLVVSVRAPYEAGPDSYQWFSLAASPGNSAADELKASAGQVRTFIAELLRKYKADPGQVYLSGFSQGGMMSYAVGLSAPELLKGIAPMGGRIPDFLKPQIKSNPTLKKLRVFIGHGDADTRIAYSDALKAQSYLKSLGIEPEFHTYKDLGHSISAQEIADLKKWLDKP